MTQAFNLSQFANSVDSSGKASLTTGVVGTLPIANGGTGTTSTTFVNAATNVTGTLPVANGGTGQTTYTDGQLLIGNTTGNTLAKTTLSAGTGITITNGAGSITITNSSTGPGTTRNSVGSYCNTASVGNMTSGSTYALTDAVSINCDGSNIPNIIQTTNVLSGTWRWMGASGNYGQNMVAIGVRIA